jgi:hypothetical protein
LNEIVLADDVLEDGVDEWWIGMFADVLLQASLSFIDLYIPSPGHCLGIARISSKLCNNAELHIQP